MHRRVKILERVVADLYNWLLPLVTINILWFLFSLTIILMPSATAALYEIAYAANNGRSPYIRDFLVAVRRWIVTSWIWGIATFLLSLASFFAITFYGNQQPTILSSILLVSSGVFIAFVGLVLFYFWPYIFLQDRPQILLAIRNAAFTVLGDPLFALVNVGLALLLLALSIVLIAPIALITPVVIAFLGVYSLRDWLEQHGHK